MPTLDPPHRRAPWARFVHLAIPAGYLLVAGAWIVLSDRFLLALAGSVEEAAQLSTHKGIAFVLVTGLALAALSQWSFGSLRRALLSTDQSAARHRALLRSAPGAIFTLRDERIIGVNDAGLALTGAGSEAELLGRPFAALLESPEGEAVEAPQRAQLRRLDGTSCPVELRMTPRDTPTPGERQAIVLDLSIRAGLEARLARLNRALQTLSSAGEAFTRARTEAELFEQLCGRAVERGGWSMALVALLDGGGVPSVAASAGRDEGLVELLRARWLRPGHTLDPGMMAVLRAGRPLVLDPVPRAPLLAEVTGELGRSFFAAIVVLPLARGGELLGALLLAADEPGAFGEDVLPIFEQLGVEVSLGLQNFRDQALLDGLFQNAPTPLAVVSADGRIGRANPAWELAYALPPGSSAGRRLLELLPSERGEALFAHNRAVIEAGEAIRTKERAGRGEGAQLETVRFPLRDSTGVVRAVGRVSIDVTARDRAERALAAERAFLSAILDHVDVLVCVIDREARFVRMNRAVERFLGRSARELEGVHAPPLLSFAGSLPETAARVAAILDGAQPVPGSILAALRADGVLRQLAWSATPLPPANGTPALLLSLGVDVTERLEAEAVLRTLAARIEESREAERTRVARDLHDDLGQLLTGLRLELAAIERLADGLPRERASAALTDRIVEANELAGRTLGAVQRLAFELRPPSLDALGLRATLAEELRRFTRRTEVEAVLVEEATPPPDPPRELATALYRIVQEALTNVARHAGARRVTLRLFAEDGALRLRLEDDGRGIPPGRAEAPDALGLTGMRERALALGGVLRLEALVPRGTAVTVELPASPGARP